MSIRASMKDLDEHRTCADWDLVPANSRELVKVGWHPVVFADTFIKILFLKGRDLIIHGIIHRTLNTPITPVLFHSSWPPELVWNTWMTCTNKVMRNSHSLNAYILCWNGQKYRKKPMRTVILWDAPVRRPMMWRRSWSLLVKRYFTGRIWKHLSQDTCDKV